MNTPIVILTATLSAVAGAIGTILIQRILPEPKAGDGWSVRWLDKDGIERRLDFGDDEKTALQRAIELAKERQIVVDVIEIRLGKVVKTQRSGEPLKEIV